MKFQGKVTKTKTHPEIGFTLAPLGWINHSSSLFPAIIAKEALIVCGTGGEGKTSGERGAADYIEKLPGIIGLCEGVAKALYHSKCSKASRYCKFSMIHNHPINFLVRLISRLRMSWVMYRRWVSLNREESPILGNRWRLYS